jgi:hypothetical protein
MVKDGHWAAPSLEQMAELSMGELPREFIDADELTPAARRTWQSSRPIAPTCAHGPKCKRVLNPRFVAWLMGWTWVFAQTGFGFLGTASSLNRPSMPTESCEVA